MQGLTKRQREIIDFIETFLAEKRYNPSYREIQRHFGFSSLGSVYNHMQSLKRKNILPALPEVKKGERIVPLIGKIRGGKPVETFPQTRMLQIPSVMIPSSYECYLLTVEGKELEEEFIREQDLLLIESRTDFQEGETILVQVEGGITFVKKGCLRLPYICLESVNKEIQPLIFQTDHVEVLGVVVSLLREF